MNPQDFRSFFRDFRKGYDQGYSALASTNKYFHQGVDSIKKLQSLAENASKFPLINDSINLIFDDPAYAEFMAGLNFAEELLGDITQTAGDFNTVLQTGDFTATDGTPRDLPKSMNPYAPSRRPSAPVAQPQNPNLNNPTQPLPTSEGAQGSNRFDSGFIVPAGGQLPTIGGLVGTAVR
jgi:hypothetical protein